MKVEVTLYQGGQTFKKVVVVSKFEEAKKTALARNPTAKVIAACFCP
tara:strand:- start:4354 stop:4494 length:141 start_codon:yes stop_codon:yes gene_type:complete